MDSNGIELALQQIGVTLAGMPLEKLQTAIGKDKTQVCKIRSEEIGCRWSDVVRLIYAAGYKVVEQDVVVVDRVTYEAIRACVVKAMRDPELLDRVMMGK